MTYDERQEIDEYLDIIKRNCERLLRSTDMMKDALVKMHCTKDSDQKKTITKSAKDIFLENY